MKNFGLLLNRKKKKQQKRDVTNIINNACNHVPDTYLPAMRGHLQNVEVVTPKPLFPYYHDQQTVCCIKL